HQVTHQCAIADVAAHEAVAGVLLNVAQVLEVARVGELVEIDHAVLGMTTQDMPHEVRADETGPAGHEYLHESLSFDDVPDVGANEVPGQPTLVALGGRRLKLHVHEIDDAAARGADVLDAVGHAGRNADQARGAVSHREAADHFLGRRARPHVDKDEEHLVTRRDEPDVRLAPVQVEGLDDARVHFAIVDLLHLESREIDMHARREPAQLREAAAVIPEALEVDDIHTLDGGLGGVILDRERALRLVVQAHGPTPRQPIGSSISLPIIAVLTTL